MDKPKVFIDGREGTTGLQLWERLSRRTDLELLRIGEARRKDPAERKKYLNAARPGVSLPARCRRLGGGGAH